MMDQDERSATQSLGVLPALDPLLGTLPYSPFPYRATMSDAHDLFVVQAPYREARQRIFDALQVYAACVWGVLPQARLWIDGGFASHKDWEAPEDVDVAIVVDDINTTERAQLVTAGLLTLATVSAKIGDVELPEFSRLRPMGGLVDSYLATRTTRDVYRMQWSRVRGPDREIIEGVLKGFLEVTRGTG